jgi:hypothetical protein
MDEANGDGEAPTWADLFSRAEAHGIDREAVRGALGRRRGSADE